MDNVGMSQQGERRGTGQHDWWRELYEAGSDDAGPAPGGGSLEDHIASALAAAGSPSHPSAPTGSAAPTDTATPGETAEPAAGTAPPGGDGPEPSGTPSRTVPGVPSANGAPPSGDTPAPDGQSPSCGARVADGASSDGGPSPTGASRRAPVPPPRAADPLREAPGGQPADASPDRTPAASRTDRRDTTTERRGPAGDAAPEAADRDREPARPCGTGPRPDSDRRQPAAPPVADAPPEDSALPVADVLPGDSAPPGSAAPPTTGASPGAGDPPGGDGSAGAVTARSADAPPSGARSAEVPPEGTLSEGAPSEGAPSARRGTASETPSPAGTAPMAADPATTGVPPTLGVLRPPAVRTRPGTGSAPAAPAAGSPQARELPGPRTGDGTGATAGGEARGPAGTPRRTAPPARTGAAAPTGAAEPPAVPDRTAASAATPDRTAAPTPAAVPDPIATPDRTADSAPAAAPDGSAAPVPTAPPASGPAPDPAGTRSAAAARMPVEYVGDRPPTYDPEPTVLPSADPADLTELVPDTVLDGATLGPVTLRLASLRGDSGRFRGEPRRDATLVVRFGTGDAALALIAVATGHRAATGAHRAAREMCAWIGEAVGRSQARLAEDIRRGRRDALKSGLHRLTARALGRLRARATELGLDPDLYTASLRCLLLPADPGCRTRVFFGAGPGGLFRLRDGAWEDLEPPVRAPDGPRGTWQPRCPLPVNGESGRAPGPGPGTTGHGPVAGPDAGHPDGPAHTGGYAPAGGDPRTGGDPRPGRGDAGAGADDPRTDGDPRAGGGDPRTGTGATGGDLGAGPADTRPAEADPFRFRASVARPGDTLLLCSPGLADPLRGEPALARLLAERWTGAEPPGLTGFLADTRIRVKGYADDRTAAAVWEA
ncbi:protein phosphatase 2C domain-containing protein [Streptomyces pactum]|uniref:protein phosphatase 2C domain-containing protein n=1 Tax=Streptomyces pactum TaxID=68249 RepID=UPI0036FA9A65